MRGASTGGRAGPSRGVRRDPPQLIAAAHGAGRPAAERTTLLAVSQNGFGKRTAIDEYTRQKRGGQGVFTLKTGGRNGEMVGALQVIDDDQAMMITNTGRLVRMRVDGISVIGRNTQGVKLINCGANEWVTGVVRVIEKQDEDLDELDELQPGDEGDADA